MLEILQVSIRHEVTLQTMDKTVNFLRHTIQFFVLGHVTLLTSSTDSHLHSKTTV